MPHIAPEEVDSILGNPLLVEYVMPTAPNLSRSVPVDEFADDGVPEVDDDGSQSM